LRPTVNLYDWYVAIRGNRVEQLWPITARGAVYVSAEVTP
jgi:3-hydroxy-D-aspartate aldolase